MKRQSKNPGAALIKKDSWAGWTVCLWNEVKTFDGWRQAMDYVIKEMGL